MSRPRPPHMPPASWMMADANSVNAGNTQRLADTTNGGLGPSSYGPATQAQILKVDVGDVGDSKLLGVQVQASVDNLNQVSLVGFDVLLEVIWGVAGGQQNALMKVGQGVAFNVVASYLELNAHNLLGACTVAGSVAPGGMPIGSIAAPHYGFNFQITGVGLPWVVPAIFTRYVDQWSPANIAAAGFPGYLVNATPAPRIIPAWASTFNLYLTGGTNGTVYTVEQQDAQGNSIRVDRGVIANSFLNFQDIPIAPETMIIAISNGAVITTAVNVAMDFKLGL